MKTIKVSDKTFEKLNSAKLVFQVCENKGLSYSQTIDMMIGKVPELY